MKIHKVIADFKAANYRAVKAGVSGYGNSCGSRLLHQFLSPLSNVRTDAIMEEV
jgi:2,4-dienoyl-CoA reductase-like NADH-dependent reductase (Old Yellow Enzyme family)